MRRQQTTSPSVHALTSTLRAARQQDGHEDRTIIRNNMPIERRTERWVRCWVDTGHRVIHRSGRFIATRAITDTGRMIWVVDAESGDLPFHSARETAEEACREAANARRARRALAMRGGEFIALRWRILTGRTRLAVTVEDAVRAGVSILTVQGFLRRFGLWKRDGIPARPLAVLSLLDPQVGYAVFAAHERTHATNRFPTGALSHAA